MAYKHGVYVSEQATSILPPVNVDAGIPMIVGTAPIGMADESNVNKPVLCYTYAEAVKAFGFVPPKTSSGISKFEYTINEAVYAQFALYGTAPIIIVNVLDPSTHRTSASTTSIQVNTDGDAVTVLETGIIPSTVSLSLASEGDSSSAVTYAKGTDYEMAFNDNGQLVISPLFDSEGTCKLATDTAITFSAYKTDPTLVTASDVIGGIASNGAKKGWETIDEVFPRFRVVPGTLIAPGFSSNSGVAAVMSAKASSINGLFKAVSVVDVPASSVTQYSSVPTWKESNSVSSTHQIVCWPMVRLDGIVYNLSSHVAPLMALTDSKNNDIPYVSPSNQSVQCDAACLSDGSDVWLNLEQANYLNGNGIATVQNFIGGWKFWGNRTACYPANTDVKDAFIPVRRMFAWIGNTIVQTYWSSVDFPINKRGIERIVDSINIWLNGLAARQYILGGRVEFLESENPTTSLLDGTITFHMHVTPPAPARDIEFVLEYDTSYLSTLFE